MCYYSISLAVALVLMISQQISIFCYLSLLFNLLWSKPYLHYYTAFLGVTEECKLLSHFLSSWNALGWMWGFTSSQIQRLYRVVWVSSTALCNGTLSLTSSCLCWIRSAWVWPWSVACVLWAYSATHRARPMHLDSCSLACRLSVTHNSAVFRGINVEYVSCIKTWMMWR